MIDGRVQENINGTLIDIHQSFVNVHVGFVGVGAGGVPTEDIEVREDLLVELLLLLEEGAVEGVGGRVVEELEAVEDLDGATLLDPYDATVDPRSRGIGRSIRIGRVELRLDASVVVGDVHDHQWMHLERQSAAGRRRHCFN